MSGTGVTLTFTNSDNGGTIIQDNNGTGQCFYRTDYRGDPHEWGAQGASGNNDDTVAMQAWLNWTPGPWIAAIPSNYMVSSPLSCQFSTTIQGFTNLSGGTNPLTRIFASPGFSGSAVFLAYNFCRFSGIAIDAQGVTDGIWVPGPRVEIDSFSSVVGGKAYDVYCGSVHVDGLQIKNPSGPGHRGYRYSFRHVDHRVPYHLYTDTNGQIGVRASGSSTSVFEDTDGWVWHRSY